MNGAMLQQWCQDYSGWDAKTPFSKPLIMGILNVTPDSFSDGGCYLDLGLARERVAELIEEGADLIDVGGESSRPGAKPIDVKTELTRVIPVIEHIRASYDIAISVDTVKPEVMEQALQAGADMLNDIQALQNPAMRALMHQHPFVACAMHMQGLPAHMQDNPVYPDGVVQAVEHFFQDLLKQLQEDGVPSHRIILDPGFGFGKTTQDNVILLRHISDFHRFRRPLLLGISRKTMLGQILDRGVSERLFGAIAASVFAVMRGVAMIRTHDIEQTVQAMRMVEALADAEPFQETIWNG